MRYIFILLIAFLCACGSSSKSTHRYSTEDEGSEYNNNSDNGDDNEENSSSDEENGFEDGEHNADVDYYNPNTGTSSTYDLTVEVQDNYVIQINWPSGGWTDEDHFDRAELDENGNASFTADTGYEYDIHITD